MDTASEPALPPTGEIETLDAAQARQWRGLLDMYESWLAMFAVGRGDEVQEEIRLRATYCRLVLAHNGSAGA